MEGIAIDQIATNVRDIFQSHCDALSSRKENKLIVSHFGTFSLNFVGSLTDFVEEAMISSGDHKLVIKRMFSILIEGINNIRKHGERNDSGEQVGYLLLCKEPENYRIVLANLINVDASNALSAYIESVNAYTSTELPEKLIQALDYEFIATKGKAGMGLIMTRIKTQDLLKTTMHPVSAEHNLFVLETTLSRAPIS